jgi:23S rRNA (uracil1939-C5)-methyltransferase
VRKIKKEIIPRLEIVDAASDGWGVARLGERVIFVEKALPGDIVTAEIFKKEKKVWRAALQTIQVASPYRVLPVCKHFGTCGGCSWQHFSYEGQLKYKEKYVRDALLRIAGLEKTEVLPIIGSEEPFAYRNKIEYSFSTQKWLSAEEIQSRQTFDRGVIGFHVPKYFDKIVDIETCYLQPEEGNAIRNAVREYAYSKNLNFYNIKENEGFLRSLILRRAKDKWMLILCTGSNEYEAVNELFLYLQSIFPFIVSFVWVYNPKQNDSYADLPYQVWGNTEPCLTEWLGKYRFQISPLSFFQTHTRQAQKLYDVAASFIEGEKRVIYDLYCGTGSIGIYVSDKAERILGIEYSARSVEDAKVNAALNGLTHLNFLAGDMAKTLNAQLFGIYGKPDLIITDPPRAGMAPAVIDTLLEVNAPELIYVSCNPATQARDLLRLKEKYEVIKAQPVDMFPQTIHVENVVYLKAFHPTF